MRLLALADEVSYVPLATLVKTHRPDLVIALGDLPPDALDPMGRFDVPVFGVYGNHDDGHYLEASNTTDLHLASAMLGGVTFAGFEGSPRYRVGAKLQFTQSEASRLGRRIPPSDVLLSHAPPRGIHDEADDRAHAGFDALRSYVEAVGPRLHVHGHTPAPPRPDVRLGATTVMHVVGHRVIDL